MADDHEECERKQEKILLFLTNNQLFVWDKEAVMVLRREHRIMGSLVGSLPSKPWQNLVFSLPLILLPEEARLLLDKDIAKIVESDVTTPTEETVKKFQDERKASSQEQIERLKEMKQQKLADFAEIIEEGREKRSRKRKLSSQDASKKKRRVDNKQTKSRIESNSDLINETCEQSANVCMLSENMDSSGQKLSEFTNEVVLQDSTLVCVNTKSEILRTKDISWKFPETEVEQVRCKVFSDLWQKGYFITNGNKFGGDYLVYPGDPLRYHSHFIVKILPWNERLTGLDLVCVGRLGSTVKKTSVLASVDVSGKVIYTSVQWSGFS